VQLALLRKYEISSIKYRKLNHRNTKIVMTSGYIENDMAAFYYVNIPVRLSFGLDRFIREAKQQYL
jgi:hypothetical protein